jgi:acyl-CoA dehydrogenase
MPSSDKKMKALDKLFLSHISYTLSHFVRCFWFGLTGGRLILSSVRGVARKYCQQLTRMSAALALLSDSCMILLGGDLKRQERISARLGDILSQLYLASCVLKYFHDQGKPVGDSDYVKWCIETCLYHVQIAMDELKTNFPIPWLGKFFYVLIFPWGRAYHKPKDQLTHDVVNVMLNPSELRERLTQYCYTGDDHQPLKKLQNALASLQRVDPLWKKLHTAMRHGTISENIPLEMQLQIAVQLNILTQEEMLILSHYNELYQDIIQVNEFTFDLKAIIK